METHPDEVYHVEDTEESQGKRLFSSHGPVRESYSVDDAEVRLYEDDLSGDWYAKVRFDDDREEARERLEEFDSFIEESYDTDFHPSFRRFDRRASSGVFQRCRVAPLTEAMFCYNEDDYEPEDYPSHINKTVGGVALGSLVGYGATGAGTGLAVAGPGGFAPGLMAGVMGWYAEVEAASDRSPVGMVLRGLESRMDAAYSLENEEVFYRVNAARDPYMD
ncbi:MAG: hypothetical protein SVU32_03260, partial [Candidatus Nanohaloarchaea archaeon]|nr:hypothetical protein [Candidatus Nanohaloarchaea archaeon]